MSSNAPTPSRCYYEVLELSRKATPDEIKKAYRKLALKWHPDKNKENEEEATKNFKEIQAAHQVLSDPQEKAWYDNHRESILRGDTAAGEDGDEDEDVVVNIWPFFSSSCFTGYGDDSQGFYTVYGRCFDLIIESEMSQMEVSDSEDDVEEPPRFGPSTADYKDVKLFYQFWDSFSTHNKFYEADEYNPAMAPNRYVRRQMEKENKKKRDVKRKGWNDKVRELVAFVKKRDKRVIEHNIRINREREEKALLEKQRRAEAEAEKRQKQKEMEAERLREEEEHWQQLREQLSDADLEDESEEEDEMEQLYCVACKKRFKTEKQWHNHEKSKKHLEKVEELRAILEEEDALMANAAAGEDNDVGDGGIEAEDDEIATPKVCHGGKKKGKGKNKNAEVPVPTVGQSKKQKKKKKKNKRAVIESSSESEGEDVADDVDSVASAEEAGGAEGFASKANKEAGEMDGESESDSSEEEVLPSLDEIANTGRRGRARMAAAQAAAESVESDDEGTVKKKGKRRAKNKGAAAPPRPASAPAAAAEGSGPGPASKSGKKGKKEDTLQCKACKNTFDSKNQLFKHLKDNPSHAAIKR